MPMRWAEQQCSSAFSVASAARDVARTTKFNLELCSMRRGTHFRSGAYRIQDDTSSEIYYNVLSGKINKKGQLNSALLRQIPQVSLGVF